jgi:hypothetical protein
MADGYRIFGAEMSPYSVKARSYFRYKAIPHQMDFVECGKPGRIREICQDADYSPGGYARGRRRSRLRSGGCGLSCRIAQLKT